MPRSWARWRGKSSKATANASWSTRSARARSSSRAGRAARASSSIATRPFATSSTTSRRRPTTRSRKPRRPSFLNQEMDVLEQVPEDFTYAVIPNDRLAPSLARRGIYAVRFARSDVALSYFAMEDPVVGGYTADKVALRRAIALAVNVDEEIRQVR